MGEWHLRLLGGFRLSGDNGPLNIPRAAQRILAFLALAGERDCRYVANMLWPDGSEIHALGSLRSALWRLGDARLNLVHVDDTRLALHPQLCVDVHDFHQGMTSGFCWPMRGFASVGSMLWRL